MTVLTDFEAVAGIILIFFLPGYALTKAVFPEWRIAGAEAGLRAVEVATLSFVLSVALTVFAGYLILVAAPGGFQAYWSSPVLEAVLALLAVVGLVVAWRRGAFAKTPPHIPQPPSDTGEEGAWELLRELDRIAREERKIQHTLRQSATSPSDRSRLTDELGALRTERERLQSLREAEYAR